MSAQQPKAMLKHPSGPHTPSPLPSPRTPKPWGTLESSDCQRSFTIWHPCGPSNIPSLFFEESTPGGPLALQHRVWRKVRRGQDRAETSDLGNVTFPPCNLAGWERLLCSLCNCIAERLPRSCLCHRGNCVGVGWAQGGRGSSFYIKGATSL